MNYLTRYYKNLSEQLQEQVNNLERQILNEAPRRGGRQAIMPGSMPNIMQQLQMPQMQPPMQSMQANQTIIPSGGMQNVNTNLSYVPPQMAPNYVQTGNNPPEQPQWTVATSGPVVGIPGVNVEGPPSNLKVVPSGGMGNIGRNLSYVPPQNAPNYVQPGNNPPSEPQWSAATAGKGVGIPGVNVEGPPNPPATNQPSGKKGDFAKLSGSPILQALSNIRQGKLPSEVSRQGDIDKYLEGASNAPVSSDKQFFRMMDEFQKTHSWIPYNIKDVNNPTPAEFNQAAMEPGGVYQMDKSGYVQSYLPAKQQNVAPARAKQQPAQQQSDNYQPVTGEYWKSPTERVVPQQAAAPQQPNQQASQQSTRDAMAQYGAQQFAQNATNLAFGGIFNNPQQQQVQQKPVQQQQQQQKPSPSTPFFQRAGETPEEIQQNQQQNQTWGAFGMRGQSPQEMEAYNRQVNSRRK